MRTNLKWTAFTNKNRLETIEKIKDIISRNDGYIINFSMFSDLALTLSIEILENKIKTLHKSLTSILSVCDLDLQDSERSKKEYLILLNISFSKGTGKMKSQIPDVPG